MTDYIHHHPMPFEDARRLSSLQAQQYALERMYGLLRDDIMRAAFTSDEHTTLRELIDTACQRVTAGIAEYDAYKRDVPALMDREDYSL